MLIFNKNKVLIHISYISVLFFISACNNHIPAKRDFQSEFEKIMSETCGQNKKREHYDWDAKDRKLRVLLNEDYKLLYGEFTKDDKKQIWEQSFAYTYLRFGNDLMKKFDELDFMIIKITDSLNYYHKSPDFASKKIYKQCLYHLNKTEPEIVSDLKKILKKRQKNNTN